MAESVWARKKTAEQNYGDLNHVWIIRYELFWQLFRIFLTKWEVSNIFYNRENVKMRQNKNSIFIFMFI